MISKLILGTVQFGMDYGINNQIGKPSFEQIQKILDYAFVNKIDMLDTAEVYGDAQKRIGEYHKNSKNKFKIITKFSSTVNNFPSKFYQRVEKNLELLNVDSLYAYMFHSYKDFEKLYLSQRNKIKKLKNGKLIEKLGVSVYTNEEAEKLLKIEDIDLIQLPFNLLDNENQREEILQLAQNNGIEVHTRSVFLQGLFFKDIEKLSPQLFPLKNDLTKIKKIANQYKISVERLALHYVCRNESVDRVLIGVDTIEQLKKNIDNARTRVNKDILKEISQINVKNCDLLNPSAWA